MSSRSERRERKEKTAPDSNKDSTPSVEVSVNANGESTCINIQAYSVSIEETNKLRAALGLKPLVVEDPKEKAKEIEQKLKDKQESEKQFKILEIGVALEKMKKKRQLHEKLSGPSLGETLGDEDALSWVRKSRALEAENLNKEKELAKKRAQELDNRDQEYTENDLKGLKVAHKMDNFSDETEIILTLKDTNVLKDADNINEEEAELESVKLVEKEKLKKNEDLRKKKPLYDVYDDTKKDLLPQYNEEKPEDGFIIAGNGRALPASSREQEEEQVRKKLAEAGKTLYSLDVTKTIPSEYLPAQQQQPVKIKKSTAGKKKKLRKKETLDLPPVDDTAADHGSRKDGAKAKSDLQKTEQERERREKNYAKALEKAAEDTKAMFEEDDTELFQSLARARETTATKKKITSEEFVVQRVQRASKSREVQQAVTTSEEALVFTDTTEFLRAVQPDEPSKKKVTEQMDVDSTVSEMEELQKGIKSQLEKQRKAIPKEKSAIEKEKEEEPMETGNGAEEEEEDDDSAMEVSSLSATLNLLKQRGNKEDTDLWAGRKTDKKLDMNDEIAPNIRIAYLDETGRQMTPKEAFRVLSYKFHGKKPGKNKVEKKIKQRQEEQRKRGMSSTDTPLMTVQAMQMEQERTQSPFIVLSGPNISKSPSVAASRANLSSGGTKSPTSPSNLTVSSASQFEEVAGPPTATNATELQGSFHEFKIEFSKKQKLK